MENFTAPRSTTADGLTIRPYRPADAEALCHATGASDDHLRRFLPWANTTQTVEESEALIASFVANDEAGTDFVLGIWREGDGVLLGGCGYHLREGPLEGGCAEIGMWVAGAHAGQGVGKRALAQLLRWGFTEWPWLRLSWQCSAENAASIRCAEANGMVHEGTLRGQYEPVSGGRRDTMCFGRLKEAWSEANR
jgi:ribosomal-protein-serine acetyltransferase